MEATASFPNNGQDTSTLRIKGILGSDIRKVVSRADITLSTLKSTLSSRFDIPPGTPMQLKHTDEDGDLVTLCDDDDLREAVLISSSNLKVTLCLETPTPCTPEPIRSDNAQLLRAPKRVRRGGASCHWGVTCDRSGRSSGLIMSLCLSLCLCPKPVPVSNLILTPQA